MRRSSSSFVLAVVLVMSAACGGGDKKLQLGGSCSLNTECNNPLVCKFSACHQACTQTRDCPTGERCIQVDNVGICQLETETACAAISPRCKAPLSCGADNVCRNTCSAGGDCLKGQDCVANTCVEVAGSTGQLDGGADAAGGADALAAGLDSADAPLPRTDASGGEVAAYSADAATSGVDSAAIRTDAVGIDADAAAAESLPFSPSNVASTDTSGPFIGAMLFDSTHCGSSTTATIDTDSGAVTGCTLKAGADYTFKKTTQADGSQVGLFVARRIQIARTLKVSVKGALPLVAVASDSILILGTLSVVPSNHTDGVAGGYSSPSLVGDGNGPGAGTRRVSGGGGGGSFCGKGGAGSSYEKGVVNPGGRTYATPAIVPLLGGSSGGQYSNYGYANAGAGGGAIQLVTGGAFQLDATGVITAGGGGGRAEKAGGGSGGAILIEAASTSIAGTIAANGGAGAVNYDSGADGSADRMPAPGGTRSGTVVEQGGKGSADMVINGMDAANSGDGGGGGGAGVIRINTNSASPITATAVISPAIGSGCASIGQL